MSVESYRIVGFHRYKEAAAARMNFPNRVKMERPVCIGRRQDVRKGHDAYVT